MCICCLQRHVADSGIDGRRAQEALRSLPSSASHRRNDFTSLGIGAALAAGSASDELDAISVVSATAAVSVPYEQVSGRGALMPTLSHSLMLPCVMTCHRYSIPSWQLYIKPISQGPGLV